MNMADLADRRRRCWHQQDLFLAVGLAVLEIPHREIYKSRPAEYGLFIQIFHGLVSRHPARQGGARLALIQGGGNIPMENHPRLIDVDCCAAERAHQENLAFVWMQLTPALGAVDGLSCDL